MSDPEPRTSAGRKLLGDWHYANNPVQPEAYFRHHILAIEAEASSARVCVECGEPWPCAATVTKRKDGIPHRLGLERGPVSTEHGHDRERLAEIVSDSLAATTEGTDWAEAPEPSDEPGSPYVLRLTNEIASRLAASQPPSGNLVTINETTLRNAWARLDQVGDPKTPHALWKHLRNEAQPPSGDAPQIADLIRQAAADTDSPAELAEYAAHLLGSKRMAGRSQPPSGDALREAAQRVLQEADRDTDAFAALRAALATPAPLDVERLHRAIELAMRADTVTVEAFTAIVARAYAEQDAETLAEKIDREFR